MTLNSWARGLAVGVTALFSAAPAIAQGILEIELLDRGKPIPNATVSAVEVGDLLSAGKPVGTTGNDGKTRVEVTALNVPVGTRVEVWLRNCADGKTRVVLVPEGSSSRCQGDQVGPEQSCECRRLGAFPWGPGRLVVDAGTGTVTRRPPPSVLTGARGGPRQSLVAGAGISYFPNLEDVVRDQDGLTGADVGVLGRTLYLGYEFQPVQRLPFALGLNASCTQFGQFNQTFVGMAGGPSRSWLDFRVLTVGTRVGFRPPSEGPLGFFGFFEAMMAFNDLDLETEYPGLADPVVGSRSQNGLRIGGGVGADLSLGDRLGLRATLGYARGKGKDADANVSFGLGFRFDLTGAVPGGRAP